MAKSPDAFRTISEVADWLGVEAHVLRFWETKFAQVKPVKRAGGRRYYRPSDMTLLGGIRHLLHEEGMTIRGVQKILREKGTGHVTALSPELRFDGVDVAEPEPSQSAPRNVPSEERPQIPAAPVVDDAPTLPFDLPPASLPEPPAASVAPAPEAGSDGRADVEAPDVGPRAPLPEPHPASVAPAPEAGGDGRADVEAPDVGPRASLPEPHAAPARTPDAGGDGRANVEAPDVGTTRDAGRVLLRARTRAAPLDPAAAAEVVARARALAERLRNPPE